MLAALDQPAHLLPALILPARPASRPATGPAPELLGASAVLLSALGYAAAALLYRRWLDDVPALAVTALMTAMSSAAFLAPAAVGLPRHMPPASSLLALAALGIVNTGVAYWLFYLLVDEAGAATASVITYVMPRRRVVRRFQGHGCRLCRSSRAGERCVRSRSRASCNSSGSTCAMNGLVPS